MNVESDARVAGRCLGRPACPVEPLRSGCSCQPVSESSASFLGGGVLLASFRCQVAPHAAYLPNRGSGCVPALCSCGIVASARAGSWVRSGVRSGPTPKLGELAGWPVRLSWPQAQAAAPPDRPTVRSSPAVEPDPAPSAEADPTPAHAMGLRLSLPGLPGARTKPFQNVPTSAGIHLAYVPTRFRARQSS